MYMYVYTSFVGRRAGLDDCAIGFILQSQLRAQCPCVGDHYMYIDSQTDATSSDLTHGCVFLLIPASHTKVRVHTQVSRQGAWVTVRTLRPIAAGEEAGPHAYMDTSLQQDEAGPHMYIVPVCIIAAGEWLVLWHVCVHVPCTQCMHTWWQRGRGRYCTQTHSRCCWTVYMR